MFFSHSLTLYLVPGLRWFVDWTLVDSFRQICVQGIILGFAGFENHLHCATLAFFKLTFVRASELKLYYASFQEESQNTTLSSHYTTVTTHNVTTTTCSSIAQFSILKLQPYATLFSFFTLSFFHFCDHHIDMYQNSLSHYKFMWAL